MNLRTILLGTLFAAQLAVAAESKKELPVKPTNKERAVALLKSFETGDTTAHIYISRTHYKQHNLSVPDGYEGFRSLFSQIPPGKVKVEIVRVFEDGNYVFIHSNYDFFGPQIGFDIFRFENGLIVEHWDNLQTTVLKGVSGRSMVDGPTEVSDISQTAANKHLVKRFVEDVLQGRAPQKITDYISTKKYYQHNPEIGDGLDALGVAINHLKDAGRPMIVRKTAMILGEGDFVLAVSEGEFNKKNGTFYDLFRIENSKITEHWDVMEELPAKALWKNSNGKF